MRQTVIVLDFGGRNSQLVARTIRKLGVYSEIVPATSPLCRLDSAEALVFSGGANIQRPHPDLLSLQIPILDLGSGRLAPLLGGKAGPATDAVAEFEPTEASELCEGISAFSAQLSGVTELPVGCRRLAQSKAAPVAAFASPERKLYSVACHPNVLTTSQGCKLLENFLFKIADCEPSWTPKAFVREYTEAIRKQVGSEQVICALSGGVDSSVAASLVHKAIGDQLTCIFVDHGLLRKNEAAEVKELFGKRGIKLIAIDAQDRFLEKLEGVSDPEQKRKIIGEEFIRIFEEEARKLGSIRYLVQGTLYPDVIESGEGGAKIKSHHNVGGLPEDMELELLEPLRELFKDEVRQVGLQLELPPQLVFRQPFPGPGLAVRIIGSVTREKLAILQEADAIVRRELEKSDPQGKIWQYFAVLTNTRAVGVRSDARTYDYVVAVRAVSSSDGMTADWVRVPYDTLATISNRLMEVEHVGRVVYDISAKPPGTIEWE